MLTAAPGPGVDTENPDMTDRHDSRHDTVVVRDGGSSTGVILGIIAVLIVLAGVWYFLIGPGAGTTSQVQRHQRQRRAPERGPALTASIGVRTRRRPNPSP